MNEVIEVNEQFYILATSGFADERTRVLKYGKMFAVFDRYGDIEVVGLGQQGIFHEGTRFLSRLVFRLNQSRPLLLSSAVREDNSLLTIDLSNLDVQVNGQVVVPRGSVYVARSKFLWKGVCYENFKVSNYSLDNLQVPLSIRFDADFADIFEVRGTKRERRGRRLPDIVEDRAVTLIYEGLDGVVRRTRLRCSPHPLHASGSEFQFMLSLKPGEETDVLLSIACEIGDSSYEVLSYEPALAAAENEITALKNQRCHVYSSNDARIPHGGGDHPTTHSAAGREPQILSLGLSLPRPLSNTDRCLIPTDSNRCRMPVNLAQLHFPIPCLDQRHSFAG